MYIFKDYLPKENNIKNYKMKNKVTKEVAEMEYYKWKENYLIAKVDISTPKKKKRKAYRQNMVRRLDNGTIYANAKEAAKAIGSSPNSIRGCCNGSCKHHKGVVWEYFTPSKEEKGGIN